MSEPTFADEAIARLCNLFRVESEATVRAFREYVFSGGNSHMMSGLTPLELPIDLVPVQTAAGECGFSAMNRILTPQRASCPLSGYPSVYFCIQLVLQVVFSNLSCMLK